MGHLILIVPRGVVVSQNARRRNSGGIKVVVIECLVISLLLAVRVESERVRPDNKGRRFFAIFELCFASGLWGAE